MKKKIEVNEYSVKIDYIEKGEITYSEIYYDGGDYEFINCNEGVRNFSFYYPSHKRVVYGYEYDDGVRYPLSDMELERYI
ncbi:MAG: hypothetical protein NTW78_06115 [Campylobacterales bacterium]|nr:hypothetical protein [Campylobacterales bacterium]